MCTLESCSTHVKLEFDVSSKLHTLIASRREVRSVGKRFQSSEEKAGSVCFAAVLRGRKGCQLGQESWSEDGSAFWISLSVGGNIWHDSRPDDGGEWRCCFRKNSGCFVNEHSSRIWGTPESYHTSSRWPCASMCRWQVTRVVWARGCEVVGLTQWQWGLPADNKHKFGFKVCASHKTSPHSHEC